MHGVNVGLQTPDQDDCEQNEIKFLNVISMLSSQM